MKNYPTLRQFQYLVALEKTKNFRQAAEICNITQPTLSAAIKEIENICGTAILDRSQHKKLILTPFGQDALKTAKDILPKLDNLMNKAEQTIAPLSGTMRLGIIPTIAPYLLPKILPLLQKEFPNIQWQIVESMSATLVSQMNEGALDLAILAFPYETPHLKQKIFFKEEFICAAPKSTFETKQKITFNDLDHAPLLLLEDGHCLRDHALSACKLQNKRDERALSATSLQTLIQMVAQGYGITLLPEMFVKQGGMPPNITLHHFKSPAPSRKIGAIWRVQSPQMQTLKAIIKKLTEAL